MLLVVWILRPKYFAGGQHNYLIICNWRAGGGRLVFAVVWIFVFFQKCVPAKINNECWINWRGGCYCKRATVSFATKLVCTENIMKHRDNI